MIAVTFDIDWAPDAVIADVLELLDSAGIRATFFATHATRVLDGSRDHEIGIHPNFLGSQDYHSELKRLLDLYPQAQGVRCHAMYQNSQLLDMFVEHGLMYDSSLVMFCCQEIRGFHHWNGLVRLPVFWEDNVNCLIGGPWNPRILSLSAPRSLYVFNFHPIHVFMNTEALARYDAVKQHQNDSTRLHENANPERSGVGTRVFLKRLLALIRERNLPTLQLREIADRVAHHGGITGQGAHHRR